VFQELNVAIRDAAGTKPGKFRALVLLGYLLSRFPMSIGTCKAAANLWTLVRLIFKLKYAF
jgi:hypothetical protein